MTEGGRRLGGDSVRPEDALEPAPSELARAEARIERLLTALDRERRALRRSEERFRAVQEASLDPFVIYRALCDDGGDVVDLEVVYANPAARRDAVVPCEIGMRLASVLPADELTARVATYRRVLALGAPERIEVEQERGARRLSLDLHAVRVGDGLVGVGVQDVTDRRAAELERGALLTRERRARAEAEAALQSSQTTLALLDSVLDNSPSGVAFLDRDLRYIRVNRTLARSNGHDPSDHVGRTLRELAPRLAPALEPLLRRVVNEGVTITDATAHEGGDGEERRRWLASFFPVPAPDGSILGVGVNTTEITDLVEAQRRAEDLAIELSRSQTQLRFALDVAQLGDWELDVQEGRARTSLGHDRIFGYPDGAGAWSFRRMLDHVVPSDRALVEQSLHGALETGEDWEIEFRIRRADGPERWVWTRGRIDGGANGAAARMRGLMQDVTEKKEATALRDVLLSREREAREEAEVANRLKDEFLAIVGHELRTPLHAISGWVAMTKNGGATLEPPVRKALDVIERNAQAQARIIEDLLDASRIIAGKLTLEVQAFDLGSLTREALEVVRMQANAKGVAIVDATDPRDAPMVGDLERVRQVIANLLSNAVKFTPRGGRVALSIEPNEGGYRISVDDTGVGIEPSFLPFVFDRFRQAESVTTRRQGGLGLGLSIVKQIVELHGGSVAAFSEGRGRGSRFDAVFPRRPPAGAGISLRRRVPSVVGVPLLRSYRILIVDDEVDARDLAGFALSCAGADVTTVGSTAEAMDAFRKTRPHAVVSDIGMPEEDGYALVRRLRAQGVSVPVLALTAYAADSDARRARDAGFDAHLAKPIEPSRLVGAVASLLGEDPR